MKKRIICGLMLVVAVIHLLPFSGFLGTAQLASLYGIDVQDHNLAILMQHRAMLFTILGALFAYAAFRPALQPVAFLAAFLSIGSFFYLAFSIGDFNSSIRKVVIADIVAAFALTVAVTLFFLDRRA